MECPFCAEPVEFDADKCRSCGESLGEPEAVQQGSGGRVALIVVGLILVMFALVCLLTGAVGYLSYSQTKAQMLTEIGRMEVEGLAEGIEAYHADMGTYPQQLSDLWTNPDLSSWKGPYWLTTTPNNVDPWGNPFVYTQTANGFSVTSYGEDGAPGGSGADADVTASRP